MSGVTWAEDGEEYDEFIDVQAECRGKQITVSRRNLERADGDWVDPNLFAQDYTPAAATGFQVWDGCWSMVQLLESDLGTELKGKLVVELGSGLAGLCAAAIGAHVLLSDVETVTDYSLRPNVERNSIDNTEQDEVEVETDQSMRWPGSVQVGDGSCRCATIDWTVPLAPQAQTAEVDLGPVQVVLAAECVWLTELVQPFVSTVIQLLRGATGGAVCYCCYRDRATAKSSTFVGMAAVVAEFKTAGCDIELLQRVTADAVRGEGGRAAPAGGDMLLYRIRLQTVPDPKE